MFNSDSSILKKEDDLLNRNAFSVNLADAILNYEKTDSLVIGLYGAWGTGKSSIANLMIDWLKKREYEDYDMVPIIVNFNPWNFSDQNQLLSQLFQAIASEMDYENISDSIAKSAKVVQKAGQVATIAANVPIPVLSDVAKIAAPLLKSYSEALLPQNNGTVDLQKTKRDISTQLLKMKGKLIVFIDDIDRLTKTEIRQVFQAVKSLGDFPNTIYILMFDKDIVVRSLTEVQAGNGEEYLKKIVQIPIAIPESSLYRIGQVFVEKFNKIIAGHPKHRFDVSYWQTIYDACVKPFIRNIRDVNLLINTFAFKYYLVKNEVNVADLMAMSSFEVFMPKINRWIRSNRDFILGEDITRYLLSNSKKIDEDFYLKQIQSICGEYSPEIIVEALCAIFPVIKQDVKHMCTQNDNRNCLRRDQRIASSCKFAYYYSLSLTEEQIPHEQLDDILRNKPIDTIITAFREQGILSGALLDELRVSADSVPEERIELLLESLLHSYPYLCELSYDDARIIPIGGETYVRWTTRDLLARVDENSRIEFFSKNISNYPARSIFLYLDLLLDEERFYGRWFPAIERYDFKPLFDENLLVEVEKTVLSKILNIASEDFLFNLNESSFGLLIYAWEQLDHYNPQIIGRIKSFMSVEKNVLCLVRQKVSMELPSGVHSGNQNKWVIDVEGIRKYISLEYAYSCVQNIKSTSTITKVTDNMRSGLIAFALYYDGCTEDNNNIVRDDLLQQKMPEWMPNTNTN